MGKFIKVTEQACVEVRLIPVSSIKEVLEDGNGSVVFYGDERFFAKESLEQIEAQLLRDEFAMMAMEAVLSAITIADGIDRYDQCASNEQLASHAYDMADAMLKERLK